MDGDLILQADGLTFRHGTDGGVTVDIWAQHSGNGITMGSMRHRRTLSDEAAKSLMGQLAAKYGWRGPFI